MNRYNQALGKPAPPQPDPVEVVKPKRKRKRRQRGFNLEDYLESFPPIPTPPPVGCPTSLTITLSGLDQRDRLITHLDRLQISLVQESQITLVILSAADPNLKREIGLTRGQAIALIPNL